MSSVLARTAITSLWEEGPDGCQFLCAYFVVLSFSDLPLGARVGL